MPKAPKKVKVAKADKPTNICRATVKWYGEDGKPYGFLRRKDGTDIHMARWAVEAALKAGLIDREPRSGDVLEVRFGNDPKGDYVEEILSFTPVKVERGYVMRFTKEGNHAILKMDDRPEEVLAYHGLVKRAGLELGDEVMAVVEQGEKGFKASSVQKTGQKVELQPRTPKQQMLRKGDKDSKSPQPLLQGVYGIVKSFNQEKGYGFLTLEAEARTDGIGPDVFVHQKAVERAGRPRPFDVFQFDVYPGREAGKYEAQNLRFVSHEEQMKPDAEPNVSAPRQKAPVYEALTGIVEWSDEANRYGFIVLDAPLPGLKPEMFVHLNDVTAAGFRVAAIASNRVTFDVVAGDKPGKYQAANLRNLVELAPAAIGDLFDVRRADVAAE